MRDYAELVRCLRGHSQRMGCDNCICEDADKRGFGTCSEELAKLAADAIEELQAYADLYKELTEKGQTVARKLIDAYPKWISVEERLPIRGDRVLVTNGSFVCEAYLSTADNWIRGGTPLFYMTPTHWMSLPEPPKEPPKEET